ncbi:MAG: hypothetical protein PVJ41_16005 [Desulfobacterales bacterium]|jgi:hypothetical protein
MKSRIVRTTVCLLIIFVFSISNSLAAENDSTTTDQLFNGHMWQLLNDSQKIAHLTGIQEGIQLLLSQIKEDLLIPPALMSSMQESGMFDRRRMLFSMQGVSGISNRIDVFYRDADNLAIPIIEAYRHVTLSLNFSDPQEVVQDLARLKLKYKNKTSSTY